MIPMRSSRAGRRPVAPVKLPKAHRVVFRLAGDKGVPLITYHRTCGHVLEPKITCDQCHEEVTAFNVTQGVTG